eukprot:363326-Chlamydomonas_euryale.AAC.11
MSTSPRTGLAVPPSRSSLSGNSPHQHDCVISEQNRQCISRDGQAGISHLAVVPGNLAQAALRPPTPSLTRSRKD